MSDLVKMMLDIKSLFEKYAGKDGDPTSLSKQELAQLLQIDSLKGNKETLDKFFNELDGDKDGVVNFQEFVVLVATLCTFMGQK